MEKESIKSKHILKSLSYATSTLTKLKGRGKEYDQLIDEINFISSFGKGYKKALLEKLKITPGKLNEWILELHSDFISLIQSEAAIMSFQTTRVCFVLSYRQEQLYFYCRLPCLPHVGEEVKFPFLRDTFNFYRPFYVNSIVHEYTNDEIETHIFVNTIVPFIANLKHKATFEGKLNSSFMNSDELEDAITQLYKSERG